MTKQVAQTITVSVNVPLPPGWKINQLVESLERGVKSVIPNSLHNQVQIKVIKRETVYL